MEQLVILDDRDRVDLSALRPGHHTYHGTREPDGTIVLTPSPMRQGRLRVLTGRVWTSIRNGLTGS